VVAINHLFPPNKVNELPTWRFVLHFKAPANAADATKQAVERLKTVTLKTVAFPFGLDALAPDDRGMVAVPIEVPESRRRQMGSLADYESDFWKICAAMMTFGFGDVYYQAVDWRE
jgi:hypothetical protein